jgi:hypothetical protein
VSLIDNIYYKLCNGWTPRERVLMYHLAHILAGICLFFAFCYPWGGGRQLFDPAGAALVVTGLALIVEIAGLISGETFRHASFDMVQYTFCVPILFVGDWVWFGMLTALWVVSYFAFLLTSNE